MYRTDTSQRYVLGRQRATARSSDVSACPAAAHQPGRTARPVAVPPPAGWAAAGNRSVVTFVHAITCTNVTTDSYPQATRRLVRRLAGCPEGADPLADADWPGCRGPGWPGCGGWLAGWAVLSPAGGGRGLARMPGAWLAGMRGLAGRVGGAVARRRGSRAGPEAGGLAGRDAGAGWPGGRCCRPQEGVAGWPGCRGPGWPGCGGWLAGWAVLSPAGGGRGLARRPGA